MPTVAVHPHPESYNSDGHGSCLPWLRSCVAVALLVDYTYIAQTAGIMRRVLTCPFIRQSFHVSKPIFPQREDAESFLLSFLFVVNDETESFPAVKPSASDGHRPPANR